MITRQRKPRAGEFLCHVLLSRVCPVLCFGEIDLTSIIFWTLPLSLTADCPSCAVGLTSQGAPAELFSIISLREWNPQP